MVEEIVSGLQLIAKYQIGDRHVYAEHDVIYFGNYEETYAQMDESERTSMEQWGWREENDSWARFV